LLLTKQTINSWLYFCSQGRGRWIIW